ncbi:MAG: DUF1643 domain-containing protein [Cyanobacteria bacterium P01_B01_bin.77]
MAQASYRYTLTREIRKPVNNTLLVCMLNPSTADDETDDPTIASLQRLARANHYDKITVVNLFALRATTPPIMFSHKSPVGIQNWDTWARILKQMNPSKDVVVLAWGRTPPRVAHKKKFTQAIIQASKLLAAWEGKIMTWVINADGSPRHPLYIKSSTLLQEYPLQEYLKSL